MFTMASIYGGCERTDAACICEIEDLDVGAGKCGMESCTQTNDVDAILDFLDSFCDSMFLLFIIDVLLLIPDYSI